ncbi:MAG: glycosyltransferase family 4 protein [Chloroflexota bacterium]
MRVGLLIYGSLDTLSGGYLYDRKVIDYFTAQGDQVEIISIPIHGYIRSVFDNYSRDLLTKLINLEVDVLIQDELNHPSLFILNHKILSKIKFPVISIVHHLRSREQRPAWQNKLYGILEKKYLRSIDGFVFVSQNTKSSVENLLGDLQAPYVIANPSASHSGKPLSPEEITERVNSSDGELKIIFLGSVTHRKGLHFLIDSLRNIPIEKWRLSVIGSLETDPRYSKKVQAQSEELGLQEKIIFHGKLPRPEMAILLKQSNVIAVPSSFEGFGIVYLEGMAYGLPAIGTTGGGAVDVISHNKTGYLVDVDDTMALCKYLSLIADEPTELLKLSLAARDYYTQHPTWENTAKMVRDFTLALNGV